MSEIRDAVVQQFPRLALHGEGITGANIKKVVGVFKALGRLPIMHVSGYWEDANSDADVSFSAWMKPEVLSWRSGHSPVLTLKHFMTGGADLSVRPTNYSMLEFS